MNNFTKSILYSGVVMAVGLVAVFAIYNNMSQISSSYSDIAPAAGNAEGSMEDALTGSILEQISAEIEATAAQAAAIEAASGEEDIEHAVDAIDNASKAPESASDETIEDIEKIEQINALEEKTETDIKEHAIDMDMKAEQVEDAYIEELTEEISNDKIEEVDAPAEHINHENH